MQHTDTANTLLHMRPAQHPRAPRTLGRLGWYCTILAIAGASAVGWRGTPVTGAQHIHAHASRPLMPSTLLHREGDISAAVSTVAGQAGALAHASSAHHHGNDSVVGVAVAEMTRRESSCTTAKVSRPPADETQAIDMSDASELQLDRLQALAAGGSIDALRAYLVLGKQRADFVPASQSLLYDAAARGDTASLITLAERAATGFGFERADPASAIFFEYLAWRGGQWHVPPADDPTDGRFSPSVAKGWNEVDLERALVMANAVGCSPAS